MRPINAKELKRAYIVFGVNFIVLAGFSILCLYFFFGAKDYEYRLLQDDVDRAEQLLSKRRDINTQFELIIARFNDLSQFHTIDAQEMDNQAAMLQDIQAANFKVKDMLKEADSHTPSFELYGKLSDDVGQMAGIQDSLFNTRFQLESVKSQLDGCLRVNRAAGNKLSMGLYR